MMQQKKQQKRQKKTSKISKTTSHRNYQKQPIKIQQQQQSISELSDNIQQPTHQIIKLNQALQDMVSLSMLNTRQFKAQLIEQIKIVQNIDVLKINRKQIVAYMLIEKLLYLEKKLNYQGDMNVEVIIKQKQKLLQIFKTGLREFGYLKKYYHVN